MMKNRISCCAVVWICLILLGAGLTGCGPRALSTGKVVEDYLKSKSITKSRILSCDTSAVLALEPVIETVNLTELRAGTKASALYPYYITLDKGDGPAEENDWVRTSITVKAGNTVIVRDYPFYLPASSQADVFSEWRRELIGKTVDYTGAQMIPPGAFMGGLDISYRIEQISGTALKDEPWTQSLAQEGYQILSLFYDYCIQSDYDSALSNKRFQALQQYIDDCLKQCSFELEASEIEVWAGGLLEEAREEARIFSEGLEEYWAYKRENSVGVQIDPDPYTHMVNMAKRDIKKALFVGAMSQALKLSYPDEEVQRFFDLEGRALKEQQLIGMRYEYLERQVISACNEEMGSAIPRIIPQ